MRRVAANPWYSARFVLGCALPTIGLLWTLGCAPSEQPAGEIAQPAAVEATQVLDADGVPLGNVHFPTSCREQVQSDLEMGLALLHHMNYTKAEPVFRGAIEADPECSLAYWGVAMSYVHPLWPDRVSPENLGRGRELLASAAEAAHTSPREQGYVDALTAYYAGERSERERLAMALDGWAALHESYPDDTEAALFHALALLSTAEASDKSYTNQTAAGEIIEGVMARVERHPGAHHYTIHAYDFPPLAARALDTARRYDDLAPENTHALHMTSHIFTRLGLWPESIEFNTRAEVAASERTGSGHVSLHRLHALDYLAYAYLQIAQDAAADAVLEKIKSLEPPFQNHSATAYAFAAVPARLALERHDWEAASKVAARWPADVAWEPYPYLEAIPYFAQALGAVHTGRPDAARTAISELARLEEAAAALDIAYDWGIQVRIQRLAAQAWLAYASGDEAGGLALALEAAELEGTTEKNPVTPGEVLPARELYGDMLLASARHEEAIAAYELALARSPNRFNSLHGAGRAAELAGDAERAAAFYGQLVVITREATGSRAELDHARAFVETAGG